MCVVTALHWSTCNSVIVTDTVLSLSVVESLSKARQPLPHLEAIYVVVPSEENIEAIKKDYSGASPMYKSAHIFFLESKY